MKSLLKPSLNWLLIFFPGAILSKHFDAVSETAIFVFACLAIIPLAGWMGHATEKLAERVGEGLGGFLNATFGNAAELIIAYFALRAGLVDVVKASLTGSILGNLLLVMGAAFLCGGLRYNMQEFNVTAARLQSTSLLLAGIALILPATFHHLVPNISAQLEFDLSLQISIVLMLTYLLSLIFSLKTHANLFGTPSGHAIDETSWSVGRSLLVLLVATACVAWIAEILVGSVEHAAKDFGMSNVFVGVIVVAIVGNAAEHSSAILFALKNKMDLSVGIAIGSSVQIALFVAPLLVFISYFLSATPMDLVFTPFEVVAVALAVLVGQQIAGDGRSNWFEGVQLLSVYAILGIVFYFLP